MCTIENTILPDNTKCIAFSWYWINRYNIRKAELREHLWIGGRADQSDALEMPPGECNTAYSGKSTLW